MTRFTVMLVAAVVLIGCASPTPPVEEIISPETFPQPTAYLFPSVPLYPLTTTHGVLPDQRASIQVKEEIAAKVLAWYQAALLATGWKEEATGLPPDLVMLFSTEGKYLSISGHNASHDQGSILWFHLRTTKEVTQDEAVLIAKNTHRVQAEWTATLLRDFAMERYGASVKHLVWMVEASPGNDAVWVDAITAEAFRIRE